MKEHPVLFSGAMVRAILEGRKTQTRRVVKPQPECATACGGLTWPISSPLRGNGIKIYLDNGRNLSTTLSLCPYGKPGDRLWVRETWLPFDADHVIGGKEWAYRADCGADSEALRLEMGYRWRPSIHMPRRASRITLEVTDVRVQRVQEISAEDIQSEGIELVGNYRAHFRELWDSINSARGYGWSTNPWVWAISFKVVSQ